MLTPTELHNAATVALTGLGQFPALVMLERGIKGDMSACACPVQKYLTAEVPLRTDFKWVVTRYAAVAINYEALPGSEGRTAVHVELPEPVRLFIGEFDGFAYPELVEPGGALSE